MKWNQCFILKKLYLYYYCSLYQGFDIQSGHGFRLSKNDLIFVSSASNSHFEAFIVLTSYVWSSLKFNFICFKGIPFVKLWSFSGSTRSSCQLNLDICVCIEDENEIVVCIKIKILEVILNMIVFRALKTRPTLMTNIIAWWIFFHGCFIVLLIDAFFLSVNAVRSLTIIWK